MRWKANVKPMYAAECRVIRRFLFVPKCIKDEWRWLEWAEIEQSSIAGINAGWSWVDLKWDDGTD